MIGVLLAVLFGLLALGLPVAVVLVALGLTLDHLYGFFPVLSAIGDKIWAGSTSFALIAVPLFILTGELLLRSGIAGDMFFAIDRWVRRVPGGLLHTNIASCALFSATSGSSVASAATIGTVAIPQMKAGGYRPSLFLGSIAAGGTLGILIPPSINLILYGVLAEVSITRLYLAALIPGLVLAMLFSLVVLMICLVRPGMGGNDRGRVSWSERFAVLPAMLPPLLLFMLMVGSIYAGFATPTEAAALGTLGAMALAAARGRLNATMLMEAFERTIRTTCMVMLIVLGAMILHFVIAGIGLSGQIRQLIGGLNADPLTVMLFIILIYLVLGCFMETLSLMIATTPIVVPIVVALGYDPIWFGVLFMILIEAALITPPIGVNLFVVQSVRGSGPFRDVTLGALPFLIMMLVMLGLLLAFPQLALWLPTALRG